jgi:hypothetical protein
MVETASSQPEPSGFGTFYDIFLAPGVRPEILRVLYWLFGILYLLGIWLAFSGIAMIHAVVYFTLLTGFVVSFLWFMSMLNEVDNNSNATVAAQDKKHD